MSAPTGHPDLELLADGLVAEHHGGIDAAAACPRATTPAEALQLLLEAIDAHAARSGSHGRDHGFVKLAWIEPELADARRALRQIPQPDTEVGSSVEPVAGRVPQPVNP